MTFLRITWLSALFLLLTIAAVLLASHSSLVVVMVQHKQDETENDADADDVSFHYPSAAHRHLATNAQLRQRYESYPPGFRIHPSYLSDTYLPRSPIETLSVVDRQAHAEKWGAWTMVDGKRTARPGDDFYTQYPNRDVPFAKFPADTAWQKDRVYLPKFLKSATELTRRTMEAILAEYGRLPDATTATTGAADAIDADFQKRAKLIMAELPDYSSRTATRRRRHLKGVTLVAGGWIAKKSWSGLKRRLLHAIMTQDSFNLVMGGHSAAAGHGNHFQQTYTLQYGRIMEPIFARLGVKSTARNVGMGGMGTIQNSIGAGSIYGKDMDILVWDSGMTEPSGLDQGIFATQGILGGDRAPFLWFASNSILIDLHKQTGADVGVFSNGLGVTEMATSFNDLNAQPWAERYMNCDVDIRSECKLSKNQYNGTCWIDRSGQSFGVQLQGYTPTNQKQEPGGRASWHPGHKVHQLQGRVLAFIVTYALHEALTEWMQAPNNELPDEAWHVTAYYKNIHDKVATSTFTDDFCEKKNLPLPVCRVAITARSENGPRARPWETNIRSIMKVGTTGSVYKPVPSLYDPPDVYNPILDPPTGELDVLAIIENGVEFAPNLARIRDLQEDMQLKNAQPAAMTSKNPAIVPGKGIHFNIPTGHCDGMYDSHCKRTDDNICLLYAHNDDRGSIFFDGYSGWLVFNIPKIEHGLIMLGVFDWIYDGNPATKGWCSVNNEEPCSSRNLRAGAVTTSNATAMIMEGEEGLSLLTNDAAAEVAEEKLERQLKPKAPAYCDDFKFEVAIDGAVKTYDLKTWDEEMKRNVARVMRVWPVLEEPGFTGQNVELAIRMTGCGSQKVYGLTHIYWA